MIDSKILHITYKSGFKGTFAAVVHTPSGTNFHLKPAALFYLCVLVMTFCTSMLGFKGIVM